MRLLEHEAKAIFSQHGISIPLGVVVKDVSEVSEAFKKIGKPVVLKPQTFTKGRGKAGLIRFAYATEEVERHVEELLKSRMATEKINEILMEEKIDAVKEIYVSVTIDRAIGKPLMIVSSEGGVEVETIAKESSSKVISLEVSPSSGIREYKIRAAAKKLGLKGRALVETTTIAMKLYEIFWKYDAVTAEINPLMITKEEKVVAADAVLDIDDDSSYRHLELMALRRPITSMIENVARDAGFSFVELSGNIGVLGNGAGLTLTTLDVVQLYGGRAAYFFDIGGGISSDGMKKALELTLRSPCGKVVLVNVFAGISRCDEIAMGISSLHNEGKIDRPIVVRFSGTNEKEGRNILESLGIQVFSSMDEAVKRVVAISKDVM